MNTLIIFKNLLLGLTFLSPGSRKEMTRRGKKWILPLVILGVASGGASYLFMLIKLYQGILRLGMATGHPEMLLLYALLLSWVFVFVINISIALSVLYFARDTELLLTLPVTPLSVIGAKILLISLYIFPLHLFLMLPALFIYTNALVSLGAIHIFNLVLLWFSGIFFVPLVPISLSIIFTMLLTKIANLSRYKTTVEIFGGILALFIVLAFQLFITRATTGSVNSGYFSNLTQLPNIYKNLTENLPFLKWFYNTPLMFSLLSAILLWLSIVTVQSTFLHDFTRGRETYTGKGARKNRGENSSLSESETTVKKHTLSTKTLTTSSPITALVKREWAILTSNSTFLFEGASEVLLVPIIFIVFGLFAGGNNSFSKIKSFLAIPSVSAIAGLIVLAIVTFMTGLNGISATSISREGKSFYLNLTLPISGKTQIISKWVFHLIIFSPAFLIDSLLFLLLFGINLISLIFIIPASFTVTTLFYIVSITMDLKRPTLKWSHPQQAMKQNLNTLASMGITIAIILIFGGFSWLLLKLGVNPLVIGIIIAILCGIADLILLPILFRYADRRYLYEMELDS